MKIHIRLYRPHDADILALYNVLGQKSFIQMITDILAAYTDSQEYSCTFTSDNVDISDKMPMKTSFIFSLSEKKYKKELEILSKVPNNMRNAFIKELIRVYMGNFFLSLYTGQDITVYMANGNTDKEKTQNQKTAEKSAPLKSEQDNNKYITAENTAPSVSAIKTPVFVKEQQPAEKSEDENTQEQESSLGDLFASLTFE